MRLSKFSEQFLAPATSRAVLSWPVITSAIFASVVIQIFGSPDLENEFLLFRVLSAAAAVIPMFLLIALVQVIPLKKSNFRISIVLLSFIFGGAMRGWSLVTFLEGSQLLEDGNKWFRVPTSAVLMSAEVALATFASANLRRHRECTQFLRDESRRLQAILSQLGRESKANTLRKVQQISSEIVQQLRNIQLRTSSSEVNEIQRILSEYVKPLSRTYVPSNFKLDLSEDNARDVDEENSWRNFDLIHNLPSIWWNIIAALMPLPTALHFFGRDIAIMNSIFIFIAITPGTALLKYLLRRFGSSLRTPWRELTVTAGYFLIALSASFASYFALSSTENPNFYALTAFLIYPLYSWAITVGVALQSQVVTQESRMRDVRDKLAWAVARVNLLDWFNQGLISRLLHGPIQNSLHAASIRIAEAKVPENAEKVIDELSQRMQEIAPIVQAETFMAPDISKSLNELIELWSDVAEIWVAIDQGVQLQLEGDAPAAYITIDICQEICSNAIRHAEAKRIEITITSASNEVTIAMVDNGLERQSSTEFGVGTEFLTTCSVNWRYLRRASAENLLEITIPTE